MSKSFNYAFLNLKGHYRGDVILHTLIEHEILPSIVIEEESKLSKKSSLNLLSDLGLSCSIKHEFKSSKINHFIVENHNNINTLEILKDSDIDLILLGDCRILNRNIFEIPKHGTINLHPGYLPYVRGNNPYIWALIYNLEQGCSAHFIDEGIDTGDVILREEINLSTINSYQELLEKINHVCSVLALRILKHFIQEGSILSTKQIDLCKKNKKIFYFTHASMEIKEKAKLLCKIKID